MKKNDKIRKDAQIIDEASIGAESSKSDSPKKKGRFTRRTLIKVMFVISVIFIMISLTYSWFTASRSASVNGLEVDVVDPNNLVAGGIFITGKIDSVAGDGTSFFKPIWEKSVVDSYGDYNLYKNVKSGEYQALTDDVVSSQSATEHLCVVDFTLSINGSHDIYLVNGSGVKPKEAGSEFLEGAIRVAILKFNEESQKYETCLVWIPDVTSSNPADKDASGLDSTLTAVYPDAEGGASEEAVTVSERGEKTVNGVRYVWGKVDTNNNVLVGELNGTAKYRCVIWLDGNDRECDYELLNKEVVATFQFFPRPNDEAVTE